MEKDDAAIRRDGDQLTRLQNASHAVTAISRLSSDRAFHDSFARALEAGDAKALGELFQSTGVQEIQIAQSAGRTSVGFNISLSVCVTITVCW